MMREYSLTVGGEREGDYGRIRDGRRIDRNSLEDLAGMEGTVLAEVQAFDAKVRPPLGNRKGGRCAVKKGEKGLPSVLSAKTWGFYDVLFKVLYPLQTLDVHS